MFCCLRFCFNGSLKRQTVALRTDDSKIHLDSTFMGHEVVIVKDGCRICGSGGALATAPLVQSKSYFEVKLQQSGQWSIGLATRKTDLNKLKGGCDKESWCLGSDNIVLHGDKELYKLSLKSSNENNTIANTTTSLIDDTNLTTNNADGIKIGTEIGTIINTEIPSEGDTIGVAYDHVELNFYLNGNKLDTPILNVKGTVYPVLYVDDGAILDIILEDFNYGPPPGFEKIMIEQSLL